MDLRVNMTDGNYSSKIIYKQCWGCKVVFPDTSHGFNRHWTRTKHGIVCEAIREGGKFLVFKRAVFSDRGHYMEQHHAAALKAPSATLLFSVAVLSGKNLAPD